MSINPSCSSNKSNRYEKFNRQMENSAALLQRGFKEFADNLMRCAYAQEERIQNYLSYSTYRCDSRYCLYCSWRDAQENVKKYIRKFEHLSKQGYRFSQLALTVPNEFRIDRAYYSNMFGNYRKLQRRIPLKGCAIGSLAKLETTFNLEAETYHPHLQALLVYQKCAPQEKIMFAWSDLMSPHFNYFELSDFPSNGPARLSTFIKKLEGDDEETIKQELADAIEYLSKPITFPNADAFVEYFLATKRMPLMRSYGLLRGSRAANSHYLDIRGNKSALQDEREREINGIIGRERAKRAERADLQEQTVSGVVSNAGVLKSKGDDAILIAAQRRLIEMRAENQRETHTQSLSRQNERMPSSVECERCKVIMPPGDPMCEQCKAKLEISDQSFIDLAQSS